MLEFTPNYNINGFDTLTVSFDKGIDVEIVKSSEIDRASVIYIDEIEIPLPDDRVYGIFLRLGGEYWDLMSIINEANEFWECDYEEGSFADENRLLKSDLL